MKFRSAFASNVFFFWAILGSAFVNCDAFAQYFVNGDAEQLSCNCYQLTLDGEQDATGSVWNTHKIDLNDPFDFTFNIYLGDGVGEGSDGIAFVLQPIDTTIGSLGGGMGYEGVTPSIAIQIDTYKNESQTNPAEDHDDPAYDHLAVMANGSVDHASAGNLDGPVYALVSGLDIEDDQLHVFRVSWDPALFVLRVYMDGALRIEYSGDDLVSNYFSNDPLVYWGFSGSTGYYTNTQKFCLEVSSGIITDAEEICAGDEIVFTDNSFSALGEVDSWLWDFNNGTTTTAQNPGSVEFSDPGNYWIVQTIVDAAGCDAKDSIEIVVNSQPVAEFNISAVCVGEETVFESTSTGASYQWSWDFGDSNTGFGSTSSNTYAEAGEYQVELVVETGDGCMDSVTMTVEVFQEPIAVMSYTVDGFDATLLAELNTNDSAEWIILGTSYSGMNPFNYTFSDSGWYNVVLIVMNGNGCLDSIEQSVFVQGEPNFDAPNVFSPNGDEFNEVFQPETYSMTQANMQVFNRCGRPVYKYEGEIPLTDTWGWDGSVNGGAKAAAGTYYYILNLQGLDGNNYSDQGTVTLLR